MPAACGMRLTPSKEQSGRLATNVKFSLLNNDRTIKTTERSCAMFDDAVDMAMFQLTMDL